MKILVVDDEKLIREVIKEYCYNEHYDVSLANDGEEALELINKEKFDLIVLDVMMPKLDGFSLCKQIKDKNIPIIILSARTDEFDKLTGFDLGIDDYVTKPFSPKELMARIRAILKRHKKMEDKFIYKTLVVDFKAHNIIIDGISIKFTPKEYDLLVYFINNANIALTREILLDKIWGYSFFGDDRTIDTHVKMLRNTLGKYRTLIVTVRGVGYKFEAK